MCHLYMLAAIILPSKEFVGGRSFISGTSDITEL